MIPVYGQNRDSLLGVERKGILPWLYDLVEDFVMGEEREEKKNLGPRRWWWFVITAATLSLCLSLPRTYKQYASTLMPWSMYPRHQIYTGQVPHRTPNNWPFLIQSVKLPSHATFKHSQTTAPKTASTVQSPVLSQCNTAHSLCHHTVHFCHDAASALYILALHFYSYHIRLIH